MAGITLSGLPLAFLEDPKLVVLFGGMGTVSLGISLGLHAHGICRADRRSLRALVAPRTAVWLGFFLLSLWSLTQGAAQLIRGSVAAAESPTQVSKEGTAEVQLTLLNLTDRSLTDAVVFELAINCASRES